MARRPTQSTRASSWSEATTVTLDLSLFYSRLLIWSFSVWEAPSKAFTDVVKQDNLDSDSHCGHVQAAQMLECGLVASQT